jgi:dephospho-CoA kinase
VKSCSPAQPALAEIVEHFGPEVLNADGTLNRRYLREKVFSDEAKSEATESPAAPPHRATCAPAHRRGQRTLMSWSSPLLVESGLFGDADCVIVVDIAEE